MELRRFDQRDPIIALVVDSYLITLSCHPIARPFNRVAYSLLLAAFFLLRERHFVSRGTSLQQVTRRRERLRSVYPQGTPGPWQLSQTLRKSAHPDVVVAAQVFSALTWRPKRAVPRRFSGPRATKEPVDVKNRPRQRNVGRKDKRFLTKTSRSSPRRGGNKISTCCCRY